MSNYNLKRVQFLLNSYKKLIDKKVTNCVTLLNDFENSKAKKELKRKKEIILKNLTELLDDFTKSGISQLINTFNPLDVLIKSYTPCEDDHSDLLAAILDPNKKHGLNQTGIESMLEVIVKKYGSNLVCDNIKNAIQSKQNHEIIVLTRTRDDKSAIDIKIQSDDFVIGIENKKSHGVEHSTTHGFQTENQMGDLLEIFKDKDNTLYIYIHPLGKLPKCNDCVMLDKSDIADFYKIISQKTEKKSVAAFLKFYSDFYYRTI